jgi:hypothetical protein
MALLREDTVFAFTTSPACVQLKFARPVGRKFYASSNGLSLLRPREK